MANELYYGDNLDVLRRYNPADPFDNPFLHFTEWAEKADSAFDELETLFPAQAATVGQAPAS